jgi:hypothetical protein
MKNYIKNISDYISQEEFVEQFIYLTNKDRGDYCTLNKLRKSYNENTFHKLLKKLDPIAYYCN